MNCVTVPACLIPIIELLLKRAKALIPDLGVVHSAKEFSARNNQTTALKTGGILPQIRVREGYAAALATAAAASIFLPSNLTRALAITARPRLVTRNQRLFAAHAGEQVFRSCAGG